MKKKKKEIGNILRGTVSGAAAGLAVTVLLAIALKLPFFSFVITTLDNIFYDFHFVGSSADWIARNKLVSRSGVTHVDARHQGEIGIVEIDPETFEKLDMRWPFNRRVYARVLDNLFEAGALAVGFDIFFSESCSKESDPGQDEELAEAIKRHPKTVLAFSPSDPLNKKFEEIVKDDARGIDRTGFVWVAGDVDETIRYSKLFLDRVHEKDGRKEIYTVYPLSLRVLQLSHSLLLPKLIPEDTGGILETMYINKEGKPVDLKIPLVGRNEILIDYNIPLSYFTFIRFSDAYFVDKNNTEEWNKFVELVKGRAILIGATATSLHDEHNVPRGFLYRYITERGLTSDTNKVPGVYTHAYTMATLLERKFTRKLDFSENFFIALFLSILSGILVVKLSPLKGLVFLGLSCGAYLIFAYSMLVSSTRVWISVAFPLSCCLVTYIVIVTYNRLMVQKEREFIKGVFKQMVTEEVVEEILNDPDILYQEGLRRNITILFADIRGFTTLSENLEPIEVVRLLNEWFNLTAEVILKYRGTLDKYMGDGIMIIFGAPISQEDNALRAVKCALEMQQLAAKFAQKRSEEGLPSIKGIGIGINSGEVVVGAIGSTRHKEYTVIGDNVNLTARLESIARAGQILISDSTYALIRDEVEVEKLEPVRVKGKEKPVQIYNVVSLKN